MVVLRALVDQSLGAPRDQRLSTNIHLNHFYRLSDKQNPVRKSPSFLFFPTAMVYRMNYQRLFICFGSEKKTTVFLTHSVGPMYCV